MSSISMRAKFSAFVDRGRKLHVRPDDSYKTESTGNVTTVPAGPLYAQGGK